MTSTWQLLKKTLPFVWMRLLIYALFAVGSFVIIALLAGLGLLLIRLSDGTGLAVFILIILSIGSVYTLYRVLERYVLYLLKTAHIAVIIELIDKGEIPEGKGQIAYGKDKLTSMFGTTSSFFAVDQLVAASVKQIHGRLIRLSNNTLVSAIPGAGAVIRVFSMILGVALNYIDEAVISRVIKEKRDQPDTNVWKASADGVVLYAQSWKAIIGTSTGVVLFIFLLSVTCFFTVLFPLLQLIHVITGTTVLDFIAYISAYFITIAVKKALVDPVATIAMIRTYHSRTAGITIDYGLKNKLVSISSKFRKLVNQENSSDTSGDIPSLSQGTKPVEL